MLLSSTLSTSSNDNLLKLFIKQKNHDLIVIKTPISSVFSWIYSTLCRLIKELRDHCVAATYSITIDEMSRREKNFFWNNQNKGIGWKSVNHSR